MRKKTLENVDGTHDFFFHGGRRIMAESLEGVNRRGPCAS